MKKLLYATLLTLLVIGVLLYANRVSKINTIPIPKPLTAAEKNAAIKEWEATPAGANFRKWEASPAGQKVHASMAKIRKSIKNFSNMEGIVSSLTLPPGARLGFGIMVKINGEEYILSFGRENASNSIKDYEPLRKLQVNDKIIIRSHHQSYAPKYACPIIAGDYIEQDAKIIFKRIPRQGAC